MTEPTHLIKPKSNHNNPTNLDVIIAVNNLENRMDSMESHNQETAATLTTAVGEITSLKAAVNKVEATLEITNKFLARITSKAFIALVVIIMIFAGAGITLSAIIGLDLWGAISQGREVLK